MTEKADAVFAQLLRNRVKFQEIDVFDAYAEWEKYKSYGKPLPRSRMTRRPLRIFEWFPREVK